MNSFNFTPITIDDFDKVYKYTSLYGERSCQHSPVSMWSLYEKYGDAVCEQDGFLYTLREHICDSKYRVYLAPLGEGNKAEAYRRILEDATTHEKKAKFFTLTEIEAKNLEQIYPGRFAIEEDRDYAEYIYRKEKMESFSGSDLRKRRGEIHQFWNRTGDRTSIEFIGESNFPEVLSFEKDWVNSNKETHDREALERDVRMVERQLDYYNALHLSGILIRIDGNVAGICYGMNLGDTYDVIVEKADRSIPHIYKVLRQESTKRCATGCSYVNMEEDVGVLGLRDLKKAYRPEYLLRKFCAIER